MNFIITLKNKIKTEFDHHFQVSDLKAKLIKDGIGSLIIKVVNFLLLFLVSVVLVRALGAENYGIYGYIVSIITLLNVPAEFGLPNLVIRETARNVTLERWGLINGLWKWSTKVIGFISAVLIIGVLIFIVFWGKHFGEAYSLTLFWAILLLPFISLGHLRRCQLYGLKKVVLGQMPEKVLMPGLTIILVIVSTFFLPEILTAPQAMMIRIVAAIIAFAFGTVILLKNYPTEIKETEPVYETRAWIRSALPFAANSGISIINNHASILILGLFASTVEISYYKIAVNFAVTVAIGNQIIDMVSTPQFASYFANRQMKRLQKLVSTGAMVSFTISIIILILILFFGKTFLRLVYGAEFIASYQPLVILIAGQLINSSTGPVSSLLNMTEKEMFTIRGTILSAIMNIILNPLLIPILGVKGAAIATTISLIAFNAYSFWVIKRHLNIISFFCGSK